MRYKYGIDFGTTNSSIALRFVGDDEAEHTLVFDVKETFPRETIPSVVLIDQKGKIYGGQTAAEKYSQATSTMNQRYIKRIKLDLENEGTKLSYRVNGKDFSGVELIASILKELRIRAEKEVHVLGIDVTGVVMGVPVQYGDIQKNLLIEALVAAGYYQSEAEAARDTEFVSEPVAVAVHYGLNLNHDKTVLVFDFGGGTLDIAIMNLKKQIGKDKLHPHETLAKGRITLGGEELNRLFFVNSFCSPAKYGTRKIARAFGLRNMPADDLWEELLKKPDGVRFIAEVEKCKCDLSKKATCKFSFIGRNVILEEVTFYRDDFAGSIQDKLEDIDNLVEDCLEESGLDDPYDVDHVILAGGSSMIPAVQTLLVDKFGTNRVSSKINEQDAVIRNMRRGRASESEVLTSIVRGLAAVGCSDGQVEDVVDSDYGVWDSVENDFICIVNKGTPVRETRINRTSREGIFESVECLDHDVTSVQILVYQRTLTGNHKLGTILIPNPGGLKYRVYMSVDAKQGKLEVTLYDIIKDRWIDEIPLEGRSFAIK